MKNEKSSLELYKIQVKGLLKDLSEASAAAICGDMDKTITLLSDIENGGIGAEYLRDVLKITFAINQCSMANHLLNAKTERIANQKAAVYFAQKDDGLIKIGFAKNVADRMKQISAMAGCDLDLLATTTGGSKKEAELHAMFAEDCAYGEWFRPSDKLMEYINSLE